MHSPALTRTGMNSCSPAYLHACTCVRVLQRMHGHRRCQPGPLRAKSRFTECVRSICVHKRESVCVCVCARTCVNTFACGMRVCMRACARAHESTCPYVCPCACICVLTHDLCTVYVLHLMSRLCATCMQEGVPVLRVQAPGPEQCWFVCRVRGV